MNVLDNPLLDDVSNFDDCLTGPVMTIEKTLTVPGVIIQDLLNKAGYNIPEDAYVHDARVDYQLVNEAYAA